MEKCEVQIVDCEHTALIVRVVVCRPKLGNHHHMDQFRVLHGAHKAVGYPYHLGILWGILLQEVFQTWDATRRELNTIHKIDDNTFLHLLRHKSQTFLFKVHEMLNLADMCYKCNYD